MTDFLITLGLVSAIGLVYAVVSHLTGMDMTSMVAGGALWLAVGARVKATR